MSKDRRICQVEGCDAFVHGHGYCASHYHRWRKSGDPLKTRSGSALVGQPLAFLVNVVFSHSTQDCLFWPYAKKEDGRAVIGIEGKARKVAQIVCLARHGPPPTDKHEVAHLCGKDHLGCVSPHHVRWATHAENLADRLAHGTDNRGEKHGMAKLTTEQVKEIRELKGKLTNTQTANLYGVGATTISAIRAGRNWKWLT